MRNLENIEYPAREYHFCNCCEREIFPGENYRRIVDLYIDENGKKKVSVFKVHSNPSCDFSPDPNEDEYRNLEDLSREEIWREAA